ncbi:zinc-ribbon domain-containing protein [Methanobrevibacter arboriphilus]|uniref:zinc-ribbon domain-containing protein n=1 Tax=Methanobrevibacter arboriphilus TaxID=39441 RepID=UPI0006D1493A|nr:zinc-ribbon domain-containing protein [Methanobrevibacter arboriphilus]
MGNETTSIFCSKCGIKIKNRENKFCSYCGNELNISKEKVAEEKNINDDKDMYQNNVVVRYDKNPSVAAILTFFLFCLGGQFYNGQILKGIIFVVILIILIYINIILALLFLIYATYDAYKNAKYIKKNHGNYFYNEGGYNGN